MAAALLGALVLAIALRRIGLEPSASGMKAPETSAVPEPEPATTR
jgi:hypothetical protein